VRMPMIFGAKAEDSPRDQRRLYGELAWIWPLTNVLADYDKESDTFWELIEANTRIEVKTLLNFGCGGGLHDHALKKNAAITGVDSSPAMLENARKMNPEVDYRVGDMRSARLDTHFDGVVIFDSLAYMLSESDLRAAFETVYVHLKPGGVFLTYMEFSPELFQQNRVHCSVHNHEDLKIVEIWNEYDPDKTDNTFETAVVFLIRRKDELQIETDRHVCGIFKIDTWDRLLKETGFHVAIEKGTPEEGLPVFVCIKPS